MEWNPQPWKSNVAFPCHLKRGGAEPHNTQLNILYKHCKNLLPTFLAEVHTASSCPKPLLLLQCSPPNASFPCILDLPHTHGSQSWLSIQCTRKTLKRTNPWVPAQMGGIGISGSWVWASLVFRCSEVISYASRLKSLL